MAKPRAERARSTRGEGQALKIGKQQKNTTPRRATPQRKLPTSNGSTAEKGSEGLANARDGRGHKRRKGQGGSGQRKIKVKLVNSRPETIAKPNSVQECCATKIMAFRRETGTSDVGNHGGAQLAEKGCPDKSGWIPETGKIEKRQDKPLHRDKKKRLPGGTTMHEDGDVASKVENKKTKKNPTNKTLPRSHGPTALDTVSAI